MIRNAEPLIHEKAHDFLGVSTAVFNTIRTHRYLLTRRWGPGRTAVFIMLNPSKADALVSDPTVTRCLGFARRESCDALAVVNLFGLRATNPRELFRHPDPVGERNDEFIVRHCAEWQAADREPPLIVAAWGAHPMAAARAEVVLGMLAGRVSICCLGVTKDAHPRHPLYVPASAELMAFRSSAGALTIGVGHG
jgi:hypothetical protein